MSHPKTKIRIFILGGGFGGIYTALHLEKTLARRDDVSITLVNRENFFLFTPMLHEVASSDLDLTNIVSPIRKLLKRVQFFEGDVSAVDLDKKTLTLVHGSDHHSHEQPYDYLVMALGSSTNFFNLPGVEQRSMTMKTLGDAVHLRNRAIAAMEEADTECAIGERKPLLTFVVAGGGFAGVETVGGINDFIRDSLKFYPNLNQNDVRTVLVSSGDVILPELGEELGRYAHKKLTAHGIEIINNSKLTEATAEGVKLSTGQFISTRHIVWTAGTAAHPLLCKLPCPLERGKIKVNEFFEVAGYPGVWALGDSAVVPDLRTGKPHPPTAQHAIREGKIVAHNLKAAINGSQKKAFHFRTIGQLAAIGRRAGVAKIFGFKFSGFVAWFLWRTIYLSKLPRLEKKLRVALDWTLDLFFSKDLVQYSTSRDELMTDAEETSNGSESHTHSPTTV